MTLEQAYSEGFCKTAEAYGVDPNSLIKTAGLWKNLTTGSETGNWESATDYANRVKGLSFSDRIREGMKRTGGVVLRYNPLNPLSLVNMTKDVKGMFRSERKRKPIALTKEDADALTRYFNSDPARLQRTVALLNKQNV